MGHSRSQSSGLCKFSYKYQCTYAAAPAWGRGRRLDRPIPCISVGQPQAQFSESQGLVKLAMRGSPRLTASASSVATILPLLVCREVEGP
jgi:hypothetical protein